MTLYEMKKKILSMIEELNPESELLTDDPDISAKINSVINQVMFELCRMKKIPKYLEQAARKGESIDFHGLSAACGREVYQMDMVRGVAYESKASGTVLKFLEDGTAEIDLFVYPEPITEDTEDEMYEFDLSPDALEILPYGVAGDLLKSDVSSDYGRIYSNRYETMIQRLDQRYQMGSIVIEGGVVV